MLLSSYPTDPAVCATELQAEGLEYTVFFNQLHAILLSRTNRLLYCLLIRLCPSRQLWRAGRRELKKLPHSTSTFNIHVLLPLVYEADHWDRYVSELSVLSLEQNPCLCLRLFGAKGVALVSVKYCESKSCA